MASGDNNDGDNLIAKAGRNGQGKRQKLQNKAKLSDEGRGGGGNGGEGVRTKPKRAQYCTICKNHNQRVLKKRHKCPHSECQCPLCQLSRRVQCVMCHQQRLWRFRKSMEKSGSPNNKDLAASTIASPSSSSSSSSSSAEGDYRLHESAVDDPYSISEQPKTNDEMKSERHGKQQVCDKCRNHEEWVPKRGHKGKCPYENCTCQYCSFTIKRRDLMKHQQRVRRAQVSTPPTKEAPDFVLQQTEGPGQQQQQQKQHQVSSSPAEEPPGVVEEPSQSIITQEQFSNNNSSISDAQRDCLSCPSDEPNGRVLQVITSDHRISHTKFQNPKNIPFKKPEIPNERNVSPIISHEPHNHQMKSLNPIIAPAYCQETPVSSVYRQEPTTSPVIDNEQRYSLDNRQERIAPLVSSTPDETELSQTMSHESLMSHNPKISPAIANDHIMSSQVPHGISSAISHEPRISTTMSHESRISGAMSNESTISQVLTHEIVMSPVMSHEPVMSPPITHEPRISSTLSQDNRSLTAVPNDVRIPLQNYNGQRIASANFHEQRSSQGMSHESRPSSAVFNEQASNCTTFHHQSIMNSALAYPSGDSEAINTTLNYLKEEPTDDSMLYDSMGELASSNNYSPPIHTFDQGMNYANDAEFFLARQQSHVKFGADPEDLQLRQWSTKDLESNRTYSEGFQSNNYRGSSLCIPLSQTQQQSLQHHSTLNQPYYPSGNSNSTVFSPQSVPYGWGNSAGQSCIATSASHTNTNVHTKHVILPTSPCQTYVQSPQNHCQSLWWQQSRLGTLERMNSG